MTSSTPDVVPTDEINAADFVEQTVDADPAAEQEGEPGQLAGDAAVGLREADAADVLEQETLAYGATDDER